MVKPNTVKHVLREIDPNNKTDVEAITKLHLELLHWGPMARMGRLFLQRFCYSILIKDNLMRAALCEVNGQPAGFIAYTAYSITFHRTAIKKHWPYVTYIMLISILRDPSIIFRIRKAVRLMFSRRLEKNLGKDPSGEVVAIGVLPEFRSPKFINSSGLRLSHELFGKAVSYFRSLGLSKMRLVVDSFNKPVLFFYHSLGGRCEPYKRAGDPMVQIWFDLEHLSL